MFADLWLWAQSSGGWGVWIPPILNVLIIIIAAFLILLVLIQKGKGGGLAGAFGGAGGSSAFGSRAGDQFTQITLITAGIWLLLIMLMVKMVQPPPKKEAPEPVAPTNQPSPPADISWLFPPSLLGGEQARDQVVIDPRGERPESCS
jgi:preprotein translocase subunit SecG